MKILSIFGREILDSRGNPTVEVDLASKRGIGRGVAPSGASTGMHEAVELRDMGNRYLGKGVQKAVDNVNETIAKEAKGKDFKSQKEFDDFLLKLDGTFNKSNLGANALVATSMAFFRAFAFEQGEEALNSIMDAIEESCYKKETTLALDVAASSFYDGVKKTYLLDGKEEIAEHLLEYYIELVKKYPIKSIEDPFQEDDFENFGVLLKKLSGKVQIVGDDLLVTNPKRIATAIEKKSCDSLLLKVNQIGTVTEALDAANICRK